MTLAIDRPVVETTQHPAWCAYPAADCGIHSSLIAEHEATEVDGADVVVLTCARLDSDGPKVVINIDGREYEFTPPVALALASSLAGDALLAQAPTTWTARGLVWP